MIATLGETTGMHALQYIRERMMNSPEGSEILQFRLNILYNIFLNLLFVLFRLGTNCINIFCLGYNLELIHQL